MAVVASVDSGIFILQKLWVFLLSLEEADETLVAGIRSLAGFAANWTLLTAMVVSGDLYSGIAEVAGDTTVEFLVGGVLFTSNDIDIVGIYRGFVVFGVESYSFDIVVVSSASCGYWNRLC